MDSGETNEKSLFSHVTYNGPMNNLVVSLKTSVLSFRETEMDQSESSMSMFTLKERSGDSQYIKNVKEQTAIHIFCSLFLYWRCRNIGYCYSIKDLKFLSIQSSKPKDHMTERNNNNTVVSFEALLMLFFSGTFDQEVKLTNEQSLSSHVTYNGPITRMLKVEESLLEILDHLTNIQSIINVDCFVALGFSKSMFHLID